MLGYAQDKQDVNYLKTSSALNIVQNLAALPATVVRLLGDFLMHAHFPEGLRTYLT